MALGLSTDEQDSTSGPHSKKRVLFVTFFKWDALLQANPDMEYAEWALSYLHETGSKPAQEWVDGRKPWKLTRIGTFGDDLHSWNGDSWRGVGGDGARNVDKTIL